MFLRKSKVYHIGTLDGALRAQRFSLEGDALSVSEHPEAWKQIARLSGPRHTLSKREGLFLDMHSARVAGLIEDAGVAAGLLAWVPRYKAEYFDDEADESRYTLHLTKEEAQAELGECAGDFDDGEPKLPTEVHVLTTTALLREGYPRVSPAGEAGSLALTLAANVLHASSKLPFAERVDGLWWNERLNPASLSAPRGSIFPSMLGTWDIA